MSGSILLPFTGSQESLYGIELAWSLAARARALVNAQHVINARGALDFVGMEKAGIVGSGPYMAAYENVCQSLREIGEKLSDSYVARAEGRNIPGEVFIDEGEPLEEVRKRLKDHDLVVLGHRQRSSFALPDCQTVRLSLAEILSHFSLVPLLIVQKPVTEFSELAMFCSMDHVNKAWLTNCVATAQNLGVKCSVTFLAGGEHEEEPMTFARDLKQTFPAAADMRVRIVAAPEGKGTHAELCCHHIRHTCADGTALAVIPTMDVGEHRMTGIVESPSNLLRRLMFDAVLFWPEEYTRPLFSDTPKLAVAS